jgi:hypothetical protein
VVVINDMKVGTMYHSVYEEEEDGRKGDVT